VSGTGKKTTAIIMNGTITAMATNAGAQRAAPSTASITPRTLPRHAARDRTARRTHNTPLTVSGTRIGLARIQTHHASQINVCAAARVKATPWFCELSNRALDGLNAHNPTLVGTTPGSAGPPVRAEGRARGGRDPASEIRAVGEASSVPGRCSTATSRRYPGRTWGLSANTFGTQYWTGISPMPTGVPISTVTPPWAAQVPSGGRS
jgi:hypothetical protein